MIDMELSLPNSHELRRAAKKFRLTADRARQLRRQAERRGASFGDAAPCDVAILWDRFAARALTRAQMLEATVQT